MSHNESIFDLYVIKMEGVDLYTATCWFTIIFLFTLIGDAIILVASIKYNAFKLHDGVVVFIQHIAVCDLLMAVTCILPQIVSLVANRWVLGTVVKYINAYGPRLGFPAGLYLLCAMTITKLFLLRNPLKSRSISRKHIHILCSAIWGFACYFPATLMLVDKDDVYFDFRIYTCVYAYSTDKKKWKLLKPLVLGLLSIIPTIIIVFASVLLVKYLIEARKVSIKCNGSLQWKGIATVLFTATVFIISSAPLTVFNLIESYVELENHSFHVHFYRTAYSFMYFTIATNIFIYYFTVPSFQEFLKSRIKAISSNFSENSKNFLYSALDTLNLKFNHDMIPVQYQLYVLHHLV